MATHGKSRRAPAPDVAPTTLTEITRRYYACAVALAKAMGVPLSETFLREHRESISCCFIEAGRAGVRLPAAVHLPPLGADAPVVSPNGQAPPPETSDVATVEADVSDFPPPASNGDGPTPTTIPPDAGLPCGGQAIAQLTPPQLHMLVGKVGLRGMTDPTLTPLLHALERERAARLQAGKRPTPPRVEGDGHGA
jgi:hypothetical protein